MVASLTLSLHSSNESRNSHSCCGYDDSTINIITVTIIIIIIIIITNSIQLHHIGALWLICGALDEHFLTYLFTYLLWQFAARTASFIAVSRISISLYISRVILSAMRSRCGHYILVLFFLLFFSPNLSGRRLDVYHTSTSGVALMRI